MTGLMSTLAESFDLPILDWIAANLKCGFLDWLMPIITLFGEAGIFWIALSVFFLLFPKYRKMGLGMGFALIIGLLICNVTLKPLVARIRPYDYQLQIFGREIPLLVERLHDYSFPSGHTLASMECAVVMLRNRKKLGIPAFVLAILIAFSRLYLYVHYPTDVLVAILMGVGIGFLGDFLSNLLFAYLPQKLKKVS